MRACEEKQAVRIEDRAGLPFPRQVAYELSKGQVGKLEKTQVRPRIEYIVCRSLLDVRALL